MAGVCPGFAVGTAWGLPSGGCRVSLPRGYSRTWGVNCQRFFLDRRTAQKSEYHGVIQGFNGKNSGIYMNIQYDELLNLAQHRRVGWEQPVWGV